MEKPVRYRSPDEDSGRWLDFPRRSGDIIISTRSKSGTTWVQMICALLIFQTVDLPRPLWELSPWLDWLGMPTGELFEQLSAQTHRRFIKTHTPLDGLPFDERVTYIVVGRHPLDLAVSLYHQGDNLDRDVIARVTGQQPRDDEPSARAPLREWLLDWIDSHASPHEQLDGLAGVMSHLSDAWSRREQHNVVLVHYHDLTIDLAGQMRRLADRLEIIVSDATWPALVQAATFKEMRARANQTAPDPVGVLKDKTAFFRRGSSGAAREVLSPNELGRYYSRVADMAPPELLAWLHRP